MKLRKLSFAITVTTLFTLTGYVLINGSVNMQAHAASGVATSSKSTNGIRNAVEQLNGFRLIPSKPPAPDIVINDEDGYPITLEKFKGKVVLFNLWATWCPPCIREMPDLNELQAHSSFVGLIDCGQE